MPTLVTDLVDLQSYIIPAMRRALCHAPNVEDIVPAILGNMLLYGDPKVLEKRGDGSTASGNMGWMTSVKSGLRYAVLYFHPTQSMDIRERGQQGRLLHSFTNTSSHRAIRLAFASL